MGLLIAMGLSWIANPFKAITLHMALALLIRDLPAHGWAARRPQSDSVGYLQTIDHCLDSAAFRCLR